MQIVRVKKENFRKEYGILCHRVHPVQGQQTPFGSSFCEVEVGGVTKPHLHPDGETFFILQGHGEMRIGEERSTVGAGDVILIPSNTEHCLRNAGDEPLTFLSVWWDPPASA